MAQPERETVKDKVTPFLKWAGGKTFLTQHLMEFLPKDYSERVYWEPFLGAGSLFFSLQPSKAIISDLNPDLINCFKWVRDKPQRVHGLLKRYASKNSKRFYYETRAKYNKDGFTIENAARFIYLNKSSFNGIFRVNNKGEFNVPYGKRENLAIPSLEQLVSASKILKKAEIKSGSYESILKKPKKGDFIYIDPPYPPLNGTSYFTHYTKERFSTDDQKQLSRMAKKLSKKGCKVLISNADKKSVRNLFKGWLINSVRVTRWITCKKKKRRVQEIIIRNYK